jgi:DNA topoisomerase-3
MDQALDHLIAPPHQSYLQTAYTIAQQAAEIARQQARKLDTQLKEQLKEAGASIGLGTVATRDTIVENLFIRNYAERKGKHIIATDLGVKLIKIAPENLKSPEITAIWEAKLTKMENNQFDREEFEEE